MNKIEKFISLLSNASNIVLTAHVNPDGDAIGSLVGLKLFLEANGKRADIVIPNKYPEFLVFLDECKQIVTHKDNTSLAEQYVAAADLIICMDFNSLKRIELLGEVVGRASAPKVLIDHHLQPDNIFDILFSDITASSTCEVVYYIIKDICAADSTWLQLPLQGCIALYTGLMTDTNNFANSVRPQTFQMACELLERGIDKEDIQFKVYSGFKEERMRMMGYMLYENMKIFPEKKAGFMLITKDIKEKFKFSDGDSEGFVNLPLNVKGVEVSGLFTEADGYVKVSLRSKGDFSVNRLSRMSFNGGGHERAAGGKLYIPVNEVEKYFMDALEKYRHTICYENTNQKESI